MSGDLQQRLLNGERRALARAITLIESQLSQHQKKAEQLINGTLEYSGRSLRIGISGSPGVGKSTFIERFGLSMIEREHKVAVLAVDPSSQKTKGSILGDKTRMQNLSVHDAAFIRPSPAGTTLGGVARRTRESILLCEASGYDLIIVETVGVGQSETAVASMVDLFIYLQLPGAGDDLQGIKKGILELTNLILINKADGKNINLAKRAKVDLDLALNLLYKNRPNEKPDVMLVSALEGDGFAELLNKIEQLEDHLHKDGLLEKQRGKQAGSWFDAETKELAFESLMGKPNSDKTYDKLRRAVLSRELSPSSAARQFLNEVYASD